MILFFLSYVIQEVYAQIICPVKLFMFNILFIHYIWYLFNLFITFIHYLFITFSYSQITAKSVQVTVIRDIHKNKKFGQKAGPKIVTSKFFRFLYPRFYHIFSGYWRKIIAYSKKYTKTKCVCFYKII